MHVSLNVIRDSHRAVSFIACTHARRQGSFRHLVPGSVPFSVPCRADGAIASRLHHSFIFQAHQITIMKSAAFCIALVVISSLANTGTSSTLHATPPVRATIDMIHIIFPQDSVTKVTTTARRRLRRRPFPHPIQYSQPTQQRSMSRTLQRHIQSYSSFLQRHKHLNSQVRAVEPWTS